MVWYYQGTAQVRRIAGLEIGGRVLAIGLTFLAVRKPEDAWLLLAINGFALVLVAVLSGAMAVGDAGPARLSLSGAARTLKDGFSLFVFRGAVSLYTLANSFVLGLLAPAAAVGFFAGAERINKGLIGFLNPLIQAYYSRLSHAAAGPKSEFARLRRRSMYAVVGVGFLLGAFIFISAPVLVSVVLGPGYAPAVRVLRILALLAPLSALTSSLGVHGLLPLGRDRVFNTVIVLAGLLNLTLATLLATRWQHEGMSIAVVSTECFVALAFLFDMYRRRDNVSSSEEVDLS
jgi:PST family polysaccharide transporter